MFPIKKHHHAPGYGLSRKRIEENFLQVSNQLNDIRDYSMSRKSINPRLNVEPDAFYEIHGNLPDTTSTYPHEIAWSNIVAKSVITIKAEEYAEFEVYWSCTVQVYEDFGLGTSVRIAPFVNDQILWGAADVVEQRYMWTPATSWTASGQPTDRAAPVSFDGTGFGSGATARHQESLHGSGIISVANGSFNFGLIAHSGMLSENNPLLYDRWHVINPKIVLRRIVR